ncbi:MAG: hypothetical protein JXA07_02445 [Spirochaetes bacterium]|nr:hypothetical protein [Spirochaetota bacterium]
MKKFILIIAMAATLAAASGCLSDIRDEGTTVGKIVERFEGEPVVPRSANRLHIVPPVNASGNDMLAPILFDRLREAISMDGRLGVETDSSRADLRLETRITRYQIQRMKYDEIGRAVVKRMWITADARCTDIRRDRMLFHEADIQSFREYSEFIAPIESEARVMEYVLSDLAKRIALKTVTGWYTERMTDIERRKPLR